MVGHTHPTIWVLIEAIWKEDVVGSTMIMVDLRGQPPAKRVRWEQHVVPDTGQTPQTVPGSPSWQEVCVRASAWSRALRRRAMSDLMICAFTDNYIPPAQYTLGGWPTVCWPNGGWPSPGFISDCGSQSNCGRGTVQLTWGVKGSGDGSTRSQTAPFLCH